MSKQAKHFTNFEKICKEKQKTQRNSLKKENQKTDFDFLTAYPIKLPAKLFKLAF